MAVGIITKPINKVIKEAVGNKKTFDAHTAAQKASGGKERKQGKGAGKSFIGAPESVKGPKTLQASDDLYYSYVVKGHPAKDFYQDFRDNNVSLTNSLIEANKFSGSTAVTSAGTGLDPNFSAAVKGHNQFAAGGPVRTGRFPVDMSSKIERIGSGELDIADTGLKTGPFGVHGSPTQSTDRSVHDLWDARARGYTGKNGKEFNRGLSPQEHAFADRQDLRIVERLNRDKVGGHDQWTVEQAQAAAWAAKRVEAGEIKPEELYSKYSDLNRGTTAFDNFETAPGETTGHLTGFDDLPADVKVDRHNRIMDILTDSRGRDKINSGFGMLTRRTVDNLGFFEGKFRPGAQARALVGAVRGEDELVKGVRTVDDASQVLMDVSANTRGLLLAQDASTWAKIVPSGSLKNSNAVGINLGRQATEAETIGFERYINNKFGEGVFFTVPDHQGIKLYPNKPDFDVEPGDTFNLNGKAFWNDPEKADKWARELKKDIKTNGAIELDEGDIVDFGAYNGSYFPNNWKEANFGQSYIQGIKDASGPKLLDAFDGFAPEIAQELQTLDKQFAKESGLSAGQAIQDMRQALANEGLAGLDRLVRTGKISGAMAAAVLPSLEQVEETLSPREELNALQESEFVADPRIELETLKRLRPADLGQAPGEPEQPTSGLNVLGTPFQQNEPPDAGINPIAGNIEAFLSGGSGGFSDEIQSIIAGVIANPFIEDMTFGQIREQVQNQMRQRADEFREQEGLAAFVPEVIGGGLTFGGKLLQSQTIKGAVGLGAAEGIVAGAGFADADEFFSIDTAIETATGGAIGAVAGPALQGIIGSVTTGLRKLKGIFGEDVQVFDETGQFTDEAVTGLGDRLNAGEITPDEVNGVISNQLAEDGVLTPEQAERFNLFQSRGVTPTKADATQSPDEFGRLQELVKKPGPVATTVAEQDEQLINIAERGIEDIQPFSQDIVETNASIFRAIDDRVTELDDIVSGAYAEAREVAQGQPRVSLDKLLKTVKDNRGKENVTGGVITSLVQTLRNKGLFKKGLDIDINKRGPRSAQTKKLTVSEAEEIRQELNSLFDSVTPQGRRLIRVFKDAIDDDVASAVGEDIFAEARQARVEFAKAIERPKRNKFDKSRSSLLEDIIDNKVSEKDIMTKVLNARDDDFGKIKQFLTQNSGDAGKQAWQDIKAQTVRDALDAATSTAGKTAKGGPVFLASKFSKRLEKLRKSAKFNEMFTPDEIKLIDDISEIGRLRVPQRNRQQGKGPTSEAVNELRIALLQRLPVIGKDVQGFFDDITFRRESARMLDVTGDTERALR